jgi:hypothetical protein
MMHYYTSRNKNEHYSVGYNQEYVLVQLQGQNLDGSFDQVRVPITIEEAQHLIRLLHDGIEQHELYKKQWNSVLPS